MTRLSLNGKQIDINAPDDKPLLWVLREELCHLGTKYGCGQALCGACTVLIDGEPVRSCMVPLSAAAGKNVTTIELESGVDPVLDAVREVWTEESVAQCGYCQSGQIMAICGELKSNGPFSDTDDVSNRISNICRCGTYQRIRNCALLAQKRCLEGNPG